MKEGIPEMEELGDLERIDKTIKALEILIEKDTKDIDREIHTQALNSLKKQKKFLLNKQMRNKGGL